MRRFGARLRIARSGRRIVQLDQARLDVSHAGQHRRNHREQIGRQIDAPGQLPFQLVKTSGATRAPVSSASLAARHASPAAARPRANHMEFLRAGRKLAHEEEEEIDVRQQSGPRSCGRHRSRAGIRRDVCRPHAFEPFEIPPGRTVVARSPARTAPAALKRAEMPLRNSSSGLRPSARSEMTSSAMGYEITTQTQSNSGSVSREKHPN